MMWAVDGGFFNIPTTLEEHVILLGPHRHTGSVSCADMLMIPEEGPACRSVCTCCLCLSYAINDKPILSDARYIRDGELKNHQIEFIPAYPRMVMKRTILII